MNDQQQLEAGIAELGLTLPADAPQKLLAYRDLLLKWNKTYNLTALADPQKALTHHLLDSLAILPWVSGIRDQESGIRNPAAAKPPVTELSSVFCPLSST
jgi:16S rRNA G527 N7-methylase RsmG